LDNVSLLSHDGKLLWKYDSDKAKHNYVDGVATGDMDGDGKPEFAVYYTYGLGIHLLDVSRQKKWEYPVLSLGTLRMADVDGDGRAEIIFDNGNNANGLTDFTILGSTGGVKGQFQLHTASSFFTLVPWPDRNGASHILITEADKVGVYTLAGEQVTQLAAPGCSAFGDFQALNIKFNKDEGDYLAIKKSVTPDLSVLYVYSPQKELVYQKTEIIRGTLPPALYARPTGQDGTEKLLVGSETKDFEAMLYEYTPTPPEARKK